MTVTIAFRTRWHLALVNRADCEHKQFIQRKSISFDFSETECQPIHKIINFIDPISGVEAYWLGENLIYVLCCAMLIS